MRTWASPRPPRGGFALLTVLAVLLALLVLTAPFLLTARNVSTQSSQMADRAQARLALDAAERQARAVLGRSHPALDPTPDWDGPDELEVTNQLDPEFLDASDAHGVMWDLEVEDLAGRIDLDSASPHVLANLLGVATRLTDEVEPDSDELPVATGTTFPESGLLLIDAEYVRYQKRSGNAFTDLTRGAGSDPVSDDDPYECGPAPPGKHAPGTPVIEQRALAPVIWRTLGSDGELRQLDAPEQLAECAELCLGQPLTADEVERLSRFGSVHAELRGARRWQRAARLTAPVEGGKDCRIEVDEARWFNRGATVRISDGRTAEIGWVQRQSGRSLWLEQPLANDYQAYDAEVRVLVRRPVNLNTAPTEVLEALFANLKLVGVNSRITGREARELAALVVAARPIRSHQDFFERVVAPAAGLPLDENEVPAGKAQEQPPFLDVWDALALYRNGLNANDAALEFSTMPFAYTSRDVFALDLRAVVNAPSGVERARAVRREVRLVVPQEELLAIWSRQQDFDEALRLDREAPWWASGPRATSHWDGGAVPPSRLWPHMGVLEGNVYLPGITQLAQEAAADDDTDASSEPVPERVFADREDPEIGFARPMPARAPDRRGVFEMHFDHETTDPEGRWLPDETIYRSAEDVDWSDSNGLMHAVRGAFWIKPRDLSDGVLLDAGRASLDSDRLTIALEGGELVLRVRDATRDHPASTFVEEAVAKLPLAAGDGPGMLPDTWSHVGFEVGGTRPDQIQLLVDGQAFGVRRAGLTRLAAALSDQDVSIALEDGELFPDEGVVVIGDELIEYRKAGANRLDCQHLDTGRYAGQGGRLAREEFDLAATGGEPPGLNLALSKVTSHPAGTPVELYGYSVPLISNVQDVEASLPHDLGAFAVGVVSEVVGSSNPSGEPISVSIPDPANPGTPGDVINLGLGIDVPADSSVTGFKLAPADAAMPPGDLLRAFNPSGGYAVLMQGSIRTVNRAGLSPYDITFKRVGGMEVVRYSGIADDGTLTLAERGLVTADSDGQAAAGSAGAGRAFVVDWNVNIIEGNQTYDPERSPNKLRWEVFCVPISIPVPGTSWDPPSAASSGVAQITHPDQAELTEWVRYDEVWSSAGGTHLVRSGAYALSRLYDALVDPAVRGLEGSDAGAPPPSDGGSGTSGGGPAGTGGGGNAPAPGSAPAPQSSAGGGGSYWSPVLGSIEDELYPVTRAAREAFQFRGVMGTYSHAHAAGTPVLPVLRVYLDPTDARSGRPGRRDRAWLIDAATDDRAWPVVVHRAYLPRDHPYTPWTFQQDPPSSAGTTVEPEVGLQRGVAYVGLEDAAPLPFAGDESLVGVNPATVDVRETSRLVMFPSGELPRLVDRVTIGSDIQGAGIPSATVDEIQLSGQAPDRAPQSVLESALAVGSTQLDVDAGLVRTAFGAVPVAGGDLGRWPEHGGLIAIGDELLAYESLDRSSGFVQIAPGGRGLLGSGEGPHQPGEGIVLLDDRVVTTLAADIGAGDAVLPVADMAAFPGQGTVRIGDELIHYTRRRNGALEMPARSAEPGAMDGRGSGLFRGRYGTTPSGHVAGTPVILFPFRYWDRGAERADAPELAYLGLSLRQPGAFWRGLFFDVESPAAGGSELLVLQRTDPILPWDAEPSEQGGLRLYREGLEEGGSIPIGVQADRIEWRVWVRYQAGAFDPFTGLAHGWKAVPRLRMLGTHYLAPELTLRRVEP